MLQTLISSLSLIYFICTTMPFKGTHIGIYEQVLNLRQDRSSLELLGTRRQVRLPLFWKEYIRRVVCLNNQRCFNVVMGLSLKVMWKSCLKGTILTFGEQQ